jgi:hypothetical protein
MNIMNFKSDPSAASECLLQNNSETTTSSNGNTKHFTSPDLGIRKDNKNYIHKYPKPSP